MKRTFATAISSLDDVSPVADAAASSSSFTPASSRQYAIKEGKYGGVKHICGFNYMGKASKCCFTKVIKTASSGKPCSDVRHWFCNILLHKCFKYMVKLACLYYFFKKKRRETLVKCF